MEKLIIQGGARLEGELRVQGAKNSALPILAATVITGQTSVIQGCPRLRDTDAAIRILRHIGCAAEWVGDSVVVREENVRNWSIDEDMMREMRSSIIFLGALLARFGRAEVSSPGGCDIGLRPIDLHLSALRALGVHTESCGGRLLCTAPQGLRGATVTLPFPSVGATENTLLCAVCAKGETVIHGAAREPEVADLAAFLCGCGADIRGAGTDTIRVLPQEAFRAFEYTIRPDRIMAATYMAACAVTGGTLVLREAAPERLQPVLPFFEQTGCTVQVSGQDVVLRAPRRLQSGQRIRTMPYPGFPTDFQASAMTMACLASGTGIFVETIFENRYKHVPQLLRMGAHITVQSNVAVVEGVPALHGASVCATDLRGGAALVTAGLAAEGETVVSCVRHIDRGCERLETHLSRLGANIHRIG